MEEEKEIIDFRGSSEFVFRGKFKSGEALQFGARFNCTSQCQIPIIGPKAKLLISFSAYINEVFLKEYCKNITVASTLKKKYDEYMVQLEDQDSEEEERVNSRKRRRTSSYKY